MILSPWLCCVYADQVVLQPVLLQDLTSSGDVILFSTARTTPSFVSTPIAVDPSCSKKDQT
jgi:hypothetical protein